MKSDQNGSSFSAWGKNYARCREILMNFSVSANLQLKKFANKIILNLKTKTEVNVLVPEINCKIKLFYLTYDVRWEKYEFLKAKNKIPTLDSASFVHNVKLSHLSLNDNQLQLPYVTWLMYSKNMNIQLDGNPWICDCITLRFINSFLDQKHSAQTVLNKMTCAEPEELKGIFITIHIIFSINFLINILY